MVQGADDHDALAERAALVDGAAVGTVGVVGVGLIGGSIVRACLAAGTPVLATDRDTAALQQSTEAGAVPADLARLRADADVVFLCVPPTSVGPLWEQWLALAGTDRSRSIVMDVSSVKAPVLTGFHDRGLPSATADSVFVVSHPMAGRARSGWTAGDGRLFRGATWVLTPPPELTGQELARAIATVEAFGATACFMDATFHDRFAGVTSHVPHVIAFVFQRIIDELDHAGWRRFAGNSLEDVLRISSSNERLWAEILAENTQLSPLLRDLASRLEHFDPSTDVARGQPRRPSPATDEPRQVTLSLTGGIDGVLPALLSTGERALHLDAWELDTSAQVLRLTFAAAVASAP